VRGGQLSVLSDLLDHAGDINGRNNQGQTLLMLALKEDLPAIISLLLTRGVDVKAKDLSGKTAIDYAESQGEALLLKFGISAKDERRVEKKNRQIVEHKPHLVLQSLLTWEKGETNLQPTIKAKVRNIGRAIAKDIEVIGELPDGRVVKFEGPLQLSEGSLGIFLLPLSLNDKGINLRKVTVELDCYECQ